MNSSNIPGILWRVTPADGKEYWLITFEEECPAWLPSGHDAECWGSGLMHEDPTEQQLLA